MAIAANTMLLNMNANTMLILWMPDAWWVRSRTGSLFHPTCQGISSRSNSQSEGSLGGPQCTQRWPRFSLHTTYPKCHSSTLLPPPSHTILCLILIQASFPQASFLSFPNWSFYGMWSPKTITFPFFIISASSLNYKSIIRLINVCFPIISIVLRVSTS
jgi:hypothetical protein